MLSTAQPTSHYLHATSRLSIFFRSPLLLKIVTWLGALNFLITLGFVVVDPQLIFIPQASDPHPAVPIAPKQSPNQVSIGKVAPLSPSIIHPQHSDLLTADNYTVSVHRSNLGSKISEKSIDPNAPTPSRETITTTKSNVQPGDVKSRTAINHATPNPKIQSSSRFNRSLDSYRAVPNVAKLPVYKFTVPRVDRTESSLRTSSSTQLAGIKPTFVTPMKPSKRSRSSTKVVSAPQPIMLVKATVNQGIFKNSLEIYDEEELDLLASTFYLKSDKSSSESSSDEDSESDYRDPKINVFLSENTEIVVGVSELNANDFIDPINPLSDLDRDSGISRFASQSGVYSLIGGSGAGIRHQFRPDLEGSLGILFRSSGDNLNDENRGSIIEEKINNKKISGLDDTVPKNTLARGSINNSYSTIAQLTYSPSENTKIGLTYVYGYKIESGIGSDLTDETDGIDNAISIQTAWQVDPNLALGGWIGFNQNTNTELKKNILTWAITAAIPNVANTGNSAGIAIGQEPGVISSSDVDVENISPAWHLECFYKIKVGDDFSIVPGIIYLNRPNQDLSNPKASETIGFVHARLEF
jgi:Carbohydrate-selective porin, OprB family